MGKVVCNVYTIEDGKFLGSFIPTGNKRNAFKDIPEEIFKKMYKLTEGKMCDYSYKDFCFLIYQFCRTVSKNPIYNADFETVEELKEYSPRVRTGFSELLFYIEYKKDEKSYSEVVSDYLKFLKHKYETDKFFKNSFIKNE